MSKLGSPLDFGAEHAPSWAPALNVYFQIAVQSISQPSDGQSRLRRFGVCSSRNSNTSNALAPMTQAMYLFDVPQPLPPILTAHLFPEIESKLIELLHSLRPEDWDRQTLAPKWKVRHVVAHLLDTQLRKLTLVRDGYFAVTPQIGSSQDLVNLINRLNAGGVDQYSRLSPQVLISLMETASRQSCDFHASLDPSAPAMFAVSWAGESESQNWFDTARELTERWHHQQQIRDAVGKPGIMLPHLYHPVLDCFLRALPFGYREQHADRDSLVEFKITGDCGGSWYLYRGQKWELISHPEGRPVATAAIPQEIAWRIFTKGISYDDARQQTSFEGDEKLALHILNIIAIVG